MTSQARAYRQTQSPSSAHSPVLPEYHRAVESGAASDAQSMRALAAVVHLPVATVRGALSSFDDARGSSDAVRVCAGTSCMLAGGSEVSRALQQEHDCHPVYCLGYCDRSPAALTADGRVLVGVRGSDRALLQPGSDIRLPAPPSIRCTARHAVVTERLVQATKPPEDVPEYRGLQAALRLQPEAVTAAVLGAGLRGRGGAAFPTGKKWQLAARAGGEPKFVVANGDEGDPGSFIDRELMERDPHSILEGMAICAHAVGASRGIVFIRSEYPVSADVMRRAIKCATIQGFLGPDALGSQSGFEVEVVVGMGSYVCGEETALLAAIEGQRGEVWPRPPFPVEAGVFGKPTVVDNVETLNNVPWIMTHGAGAFAAMGSPESKGTKALCFNHGFARPGIVEVEFGATLKSAIEDLAGGGSGGDAIEAVLLGGPMGSIVTREDWDAPICFSGMGKRGINLGHGGMVALPRRTDYARLLRHLTAFMRDESCGKCVPCRLGTARVHALCRQTHGVQGESRRELESVLDLMRDASLCAFGRETPGPVRTILEKFGDRLDGEGNS